MAAKIICGCCEATIQVGNEGRVVVGRACEGCKAKLRAESNLPILRPQYAVRPRAV
jgi:hypothetical protein